MLSDDIIFRLNEMRDKYYGASYSQAIGQLFKELEKKDDVIAEKITIAFKLNEEIRRLKGEPK